MNIGAQLYTVRELCRSEEETTRVLKAIAEIGYPGVQVSGIAPFDPKRLKDTCDSLGLRIALTHNPAGRLKNELKAIIEEHMLFGCRYIGLGAMGEQYRTDLENYKNFVNEFKPVAQEIAANGMLFMYHNHDFEWNKIDGKLLIERLAEDFTPDEMGFTLDTYWVQAGGGDPAAWIEKLCGRVPCVHYKDMAHTPAGQIMAPVMRGNLNWRRIFEASKNSGVEWAFVEQDYCYGENPIDCLAESYRNICASLADC